MTKFKTSPVVVIDASIPLQILLDGNTHTAKKLSQFSAKYYTSPIFYLECANALKSKLASESISQSALTKIYALPINPLSLTDTDLKYILAMAHQNKTTTYDSSYHYLAIEKNGIFITADKKYFDSASHLGHIEYWG